MRSQSSRVTTVQHDAPLTCWSCLYGRTDGCEADAVGWPWVELARCERGVYEPGSDEVERDEVPGKRDGSDLAEVST